MGEIMLRVGWVWWDVGGRGGDDENAWDRLERSGVGGGEEGEGD